MIKVVLFDWGGVLVDGGAWFASYTKDVLHCTISDMETFVAEHAKLSAGRVDQVEFETVLKRLTGIEALPKDFWWPDDLLYVRPRLKELCGVLKNSGLKVGVLSNMSEVSARAISEAGGYDGFDPLIISWSVGASKPDSKIYDLAVEKSGVKPEEILFIDDHESNLMYPQKIGMKTVLAQSAEQVVEDVNRVLGEGGLSLIQ